MRKFVVSVMTLALLTAVVCGTAFAQTSPTTPPAQPSAPSQTAPAQTPSTPSAPGQVPRVSGLKAFSAEADYMSLPGYLRYLMYQQTNQWITYSEARRMAQQQGAL